MRPKTKLQKEVIERAKTLSPLTSHQERLIKRHTISHIAKVYANGTIECLDCNHTWKVKKGNKKLSENDKVRCPHCKTTLYVDLTRKRKFVCKDYALKVERCGKFQVMRMFFVKGVFRTGFLADISIREVFQKWLDPQGKTTIMSLPRQGMSIYIDAWIWDKELELKNENCAHSAILEYTLAKMTVIPNLKRNGFNGDTHGIPPTILFPLLLNNPKIETLAKADQWDMVRYFCKSRDYLETLWPSIRIAIRNRYIIKDTSLWCDLVISLGRLGKDTRNPLLICPENLNEMHDKCVKALNAKYEKQRAKRMREVEQARERRYIEDKKRVLKDEEAYQEKKKHFFDIELKDNEITIQPLKSVSDFIDEASILHHCCFANKYYEKENSLILHAIVEGVPTETIEIDLNSMQILQCRAKFNGTSDYHDRIIKLMTANLHEVAKRMTA